MKICAVVILIGLAISFALVAFAQEKEEINPFPFRPILLVFLTRRARNCLVSGLLNALSDSLVAPIGQRW